MITLVPRDMEKYHQSTVGSVSDSVHFYGNRIMCVRHNIMINYGCINLLVSDAMLLLPQQ